MVRLASLCRAFSSLPGPGGILQQDPYLLDGINMVFEAVNEREQREAKKQHGTGNTRA